MDSSRLKHSSTSSLLVKVLQYFFPWRVMVIELKFFLLEYSADSLIYTILSNATLFFGVHTSPSPSPSYLSVSERLSELSLSLSTSKGVGVGLCCFVSLAILSSERQSLQCWWQPCWERHPQRQYFLSRQESDESESLKLRSLASLLLCLVLGGLGDLPSSLNYCGSAVERRQVELLL